MVPRTGRSSNRGRLYFACCGPGAQPTDRSSEPHCGLTHWLARARLLVVPPCAEGGCLSEAPLARAAPERRDGRTGRVGGGIAEASGCASASGSVPTSCTTTSAARPRRTSSPRFAGSTRSASTTWRSSSTTPAVMWRTWPRAKPRSFTPRWSTPARAGFSCARPTTPTTGCWTSSSASGLLVTWRTWGAGSIRASACTGRARRSARASSVPGIWTAWPKPFVASRRCGTTTRSTTGHACRASCTCADSPGGRA